MSSHAADGRVAPESSYGKSAPERIQVINAPQQGRNSDVPTSDKWKFRDVQWKRVITSQLWATALITLIPIAALGVIHFAVTPRHRTFSIYDATISYVNHKNTTNGDTIPVAAAIIVPFVLIVISLCVGELILFRKVHRSVTEAVCVMLHFFIDICVAFLFTIFMTELTKVATGVLRPDFLYKCEPQNLPVGAGPIKINIGISANDALAAHPCGGDAKTIKDARQSFVSGHASSATVFAFYHCGYFLWTVFYRHRHSTMTSIVKRKGRGGAFLKDLGQGLAVYWCLILIMFAWFTGVTRIIDNKHSTADVVGGFILGAMIGLVFVIKAVATAKYVVGKGPAFNFAHSFDLDHGFLDRPSEMADHGARSLAPGRSPFEAGGSRMNSVAERSNGVELV